MNTASNSVNLHNNYRKILSSNNEHHDNSSTFRKSLDTRIAESTNDSSKFDNLADLDVCFF